MGPFKNILIDRKKGNTAIIKKKVHSPFLKSEKIDTTREHHDYYKNLVRHFFYLPSE